MFCFLTVFDIPGTVFPTEGKINDENFSALNQFVKDQPWDSVVALMAYGDPLKLVDWFNNEMFIEKKLQFTVNLVQPNFPNTNAFSDCNSRNVVHLLCPNAEEYDAKRATDPTYIAKWKSAFLCKIAQDLVAERDETRVSFITDDSELLKLVRKESTDRKIKTIKLQLATKDDYLINIASAKKMHDPPKMQSMLSTVASNPNRPRQEQKDQNLDSTIIFAFFDFDLTLTDVHSGGWPMKRKMNLSIENWRTISMIFGMCTMKRTDNAVIYPIILSRCVDTELMEFLQTKPPKNGYMPPFVGLNDFKSEIVPGAVTVICPTKETYQAHSNVDFWAQWKNFYAEKFVNHVAGQEKEKQCPIFFADDTLLNVQIMREELNKRKYTNLRCVFQRPGDYQSLIPKVEYFLANYKTPRRGGCK